MLIIGGISLYRTFALYKEEKSFNVLRGKVPDFSLRDIILAFTIDGEQQKEKTFPNKNDGYVVEQVECEDGVEANWNNSSWSLEDIKNTRNVAKKVKCTVAFKTINKESGLNGADPVLKGELVAVKVDKDDGTVTKADATKTDWYNYEQHEWANAIIPTSEAKDTVANLGAGETINENQIESYFVWIPKYSYKLFDMGNYTSTSTTSQDKSNQAIDIRFGLEDTQDDAINHECATPMNKEKTQGLSGQSGACEVGDWMTHPAFISFNVTGFWVGKFGTGYKDSETPGNKLDSNEIRIKPNLKRWQTINVYNIFMNSKNYKEELQSHMMKNTEWGAVIYLTQSIYGRCDGAKCTEVATNNTYITGTSGSSASYTNPECVASSTTGNYTGIYDMSGSGFEYTASVMLTANSSEPQYAQSTFSKSNFPEDKRFYEVYNYSAADGNYNRRILGDATGELGPIIQGTSKELSFYNDLIRYMYNNKPWVMRGGHCGMSSSGGCSSYGKEGGIAALLCETGENYANRGFRIVLAIP